MNLSLKSFLSFLLFVFNCLCLQEFEAVAQQTLGSKDPEYPSGDPTSYANFQESSLQRIYESKTVSLSMRLTPKQDIQQTLQKLLSSKFMRPQKTALSIVSAVGSVEYCWIRFCNTSTLTKVQGPMEIVSLSGTLDWNLRPHIHISVSNGQGITYGGHLPSLDQRKQQSIKLQSDDGQNEKFDCPIFTTLQLTLLSHENLIYQRKIDPETTYDELTIRKKTFWK